ncbi:hypothetical protein [Enterococcus lactis]|uniref:hypothetical protein n=1 Tax=Enterococcus lactis TaxID=357441 RepID=UPI0022E77E11|nr:hypothetical protein [Enterococcus lactis]
MEEKIVYSIDPATLGQKKTVATNYKINTLYETEVEPPANYLILAWDNKTRSWYDAGANVNGQLKPVMAMVSQLLKQNADYGQRLAKLESYHRIDTPLEDPEGSAE